MKTIITFAVALTALTSLAKGLYSGAGALSPMEARFERASGNTNAVSTRVQNTMRASSRGHTAVAAETRRQADAMKEQMKNAGCSGASKSCKGGTCPAASSCCPKVRVTKSCDGKVSATITSQSGKTTTKTLYTKSSCCGNSKSCTKSSSCIKKSK